jgi:hypothetical protein
MYSEYDVRAACYKIDVDSEQKVQHPKASVDDVIRWLSEESIGAQVDDSDKQYRARIATAISKNRMLYSRGEEILQTAKVVETPRFTAFDGEGATLLNELTNNEELLSEPVVMPAGYRAFVETYRYVALAKRKKGAKE